MRTNREYQAEQPYQAVAHWIGVRQDWRSLGGCGLDHLVSIPVGDLKTHALLIGATGSGKTNCIHHLIAQDVIEGHSFAVLDLRGDLVAGALEICAGRVDPHLVRLLNLREGAGACGFDPLSGSGEPYFRALGVLDAVANQSESWGVQLAETLRNALMLLAEGERALTDLDRLFHDRSFRSSLLRHCQSESVGGFWTRFDELSSEKRATLAMPVLNKVSALTATEGLRRVLGHPAPMDLGAHLATEGSVLLVSLAADQLHGAGRMMGRLVLSSVCREIFSRVGDAESRRNPVRLYVDEFEHFGTEEFETVLAEGRRFGFTLVLAHQTLCQLSPRLRSLVLGNVGVKLVFRSGRDDAATLSKDLTGDPKALPLTDLKTGEAILWTRRDGCVPVEINTPIVGDVGALSSRAQRFVAEVQAQSSDPVRERQQSDTFPEHQPSDTHSASDHRESCRNARLEDWLCT